MRHQRNLNIPGAVHPTTCEVATWRAVGNSKNLMPLGKTGVLIRSDSDVSEVGSGCWIWT